MADKIDFMQNQNNFIGWALMHLLVGHEDVIKNKPRGEEKAYNVEVRIDGVEVSFKEMCSVLESDFDHQVKAAAVKLLQERFNHMNDILYNLEQKVVGAAKDEFGLWNEER